MDGPWGDIHCAEAVNALASGRAWPRLQTLQTFAFPHIFDDGVIDINSVPCLTDVELYGSLRGADLVALRRGQRFCAMLSSLDLHIRVCEDDPADAFYNGLTELLQATPKLEFLSMDVTECRCRDLGFLAAAELPILRTLLLCYIPANTSLSPIFATPKPSLESLTVNGFLVTLEEAQPLVSAVLPSLKKLNLELYCDDSSFLSDLPYTTLTELHLKDCVMFDADADVVATALARLPLLEILCLHPSDADLLEADMAMDYLLSGPTLPRLRRLDTSGAWADSDDSVEVLTELAAKLPNLEELVMGAGRISWMGMGMLEDVGRAGTWPRLRLIQFAEID